ncbi:MAG: PIN domain-containing protein [Bacteroidales bacterium]|nr:PIN domain-containing protein [Bacteroidales bacterium]
MKRVLIDTDVILDFFLDRQPFSENASKIFALCENRIISGYITPVILSNVYYILRQIARHNRVIEKLNQLLSIADVLTMDKNVVINALNSSFKDFEDALQYFAAVNKGNIDAIITRNVKDFKTSEIGVLTPESYVRTINAML